MNRSWLVRAGALAAGVALLGGCFLPPPSQMHAELSVVVNGTATCDETECFLGATVHVYNTGPVATDGVVVVTPQTGSPTFISQGTCDDAPLAAETGHCQITTVQFQRVLPGDPPPYTITYSATDGDVSATGSDSVDGTFD